MKTSTLALFLYAYAKDCSKEEEEICNDFMKAHEYMGRKVARYAECFTAPFYLQATRTVCSTKCLEPLIQASQLVQKVCSKSCLTAKEYDTEYKNLAYRPWSNRQGAEAACAKDELGRTCMAVLQQAETLITNNPNHHSPADTQVICSPCVKSLFDIYSDNPNDYPHVYFHQITDPDAIFAKINLTCKFNSCPRSE